MLEMVWQVLMAVGVAFVVVTPHYFVLAAAWATLANIIHGDWEEAGLSAVAAAVCGIIVYWLWWS